MKLIRLAMIGIGVVVLVRPGGTAGADNLTVRAERLDGTTVSGDWLGSPDGRGIELRTAEGITTLTVDDLSAVTLGSADQTCRTDVIFYLADGGRLCGELVGAGTDAVVGRTALGMETRLAFDRLAAVQLARGEKHKRAEEAFQAALAAKLPGQDQLISRDADDARTLQGRLESLEAERGLFEFSGKSRSFQTAKIFGVVLAAGVGKNVTYPVTVELRDGSVFSGAMERADVRVLRLTASIGVTTDVPMAEVVRLRFRSDRLVYVSDLQPLSERIDGILHRPWPVQRDRNVAGGRLSIGGRTYERGLGTHSRTELSYELGAAYETLVATIGLDDAVRPRGQVVYRVLGDGVVRFDSGPVTGLDGPRDIVVDLTGVKGLTLIVDYGEELDLSDYADWGGARLLKPAGRAQTGKDGDR